MTISRVHAIVLFVQDLETSIAFYRDKLGLEVVVRENQMAAFKMSDQNFALVQISQAADMINVETTAFEAQSGKLDRVMLCASLDNVDEAYERFKANGVEFTKAPVDQFWGIRAAYFRDPEGNVWEIYHPIPQKEN